MEDWRPEQAGRAQSCSPDKLMWTESPAFLLSKFWGVDTEEAVMEERNIQKELVQLSSQCIYSNAKSQKKLVQFCSEPGCQQVHIWCVPPQTQCPEQFWVESLLPWQLVVVEEISLLISIFRMWSADRVGTWSSVQVKIRMRLLVPPNFWCLSSAPNKKNIREKKCSCLQL